MNYLYHRTFLNLIPYVRKVGISGKNQKFPQLRKWYAIINPAVIYAAGKGLSIMKCKVSIPERMKDLRVERHLSLKELEAAVGISKSALGSYESTEGCKEINHGSILKLADFYQVSTDYLLCLTDNRNPENIELTELHISDEMAKLLKGGRINNRLLCEIAANENFELLMADTEIYMDGIATMRLRDLNSSLEAARAMILEDNPEAAGDRFMQTLEAGQIGEEDFFCHITHKSWGAILRDIQKAHEKDFESAPDETPANDLIKKVRRAMQSPGDKVEQFTQVLCQAFQLKYQKLADNEKSILKNLFKKSPLIKTQGMNFRRRRK